MELSTEAKEKRNEYMRDYLRKHPEKKAKYNNDYWERKAQQEQNNNNQIFSETERGFKNEN